MELRVNLLLYFRLLLIKLYFRAHSLVCLAKYLFESTIGKCLKREFTCYKSSKEITSKPSEQRHWSGLCWDRLGKINRILGYGYSWWIHTKKSFPTDKEWKAVHIFRCIKYFYLLQYFIPSPHTTDYQKTLKVSFTIF